MMTGTTSERGKRMTRKDLEQLRALKFEIRSIEIAMMRPKSKEQVSFYKDYRTGKGIPKSLTGYDGGREESEKLEAELKRKKKQHLKRVAEIEAWIDGIDDPEMRGIIRLYYCEGRSQKDIGEELGYDQSAISYKIKRFLKQVSYNS